MAAMYESIILCVIAIVIYTSAAYKIDRNICLETAIRFIYGQYGCQFRYGDANTILREAETCTNKCKIQMYHLNYQDTHYLRQVIVTIGTWQTSMQSICQPSHMSYEPIHMSIKCLLWNKDKYRVMNTTDCRLSYAQCYKIANYCICHCFYGYIMVDGICLKENLMVGQSCSYDMQCTGTEFASTCQYGWCECQSGYTLIGNNCYPENVTVSHYCSYQWQCTGTEYASVCINGRCECQSGYILIRNNCYQGKITIGKLCVSDLQCTGTLYASLCQNGLCSCRLGFITYHNNCFPAKNVTVGHSCSYHWQCTGTQFASFCDHYQCECQSGYILIDNNCYPDHIPVGGFCNEDKQCTGSNNSETCTDGRCRCSDRHILLDLECIPGNLSLNQSCIAHEQCSSSNYSRCVDEKCKCMEGYTAENLTSCIKSQPNEFENSVRNIQDNNIGKILGTLFGGILIGVILTAVIAFLIFKKMRTKIKKREEPIVMFANDAIYSSASVVEREDNTGFQANDKKRKVVNVLPYACSEKGAEYSFVTRKPRIEQPTAAGVYNHLHEQEKHDNDDDDNYDHASAASYLGREPCVYSNMP